MLHVTESKRDGSSAPQLGGDPSTTLNPLESLPLLAALPPAATAALAASCQPVALRAGDKLFAAGDPPDAIYFLLSGALGSCLDDEAGAPRLLGRVKPGEPVGEMGVLTGKPRSTDIVALRDSELLRLPREDFERVVSAYPQSVLGVSRVIIERLEERNRARPGPVRPKTVALLPVVAGVGVAPLAERLAAALSGMLRVTLIGPQHAGDMSPARLSALETSHDLVVYHAAEADDAWSRLCSRQADLRLLVADSRTMPPAGGSVGGGLLVGPAHNRHLQRSELLLLHETGIVPGAASRWAGALAAAGSIVEMHHHLRGDTHAEVDLRRLCRLLVGGASGLVLSGGGARGFAHLGVMRALEEAAIGIDVVSGTSIGAIMGASFAAGMTDEARVQLVRRTFVDSNPLGDFTLPFASMVRGRRVSERLQQVFGDRDIEDLPLPFACISADLNSGRPRLHRRGKLWQALRASVAIPGVLPPVMQEGAVLVDGGTLDNFPVGVVRGMGASWVLGVDIGSNVPIASDVEGIDMPAVWDLQGWRNRWRASPSILQILMRSALMQSSAAAAVSRLSADLLLTPRLPGVGLLDWKSFDASIRAGYEHASTRFNEWRGTDSGDPGAARRGT
jgi:NTE family protein